MEPSPRLLILGIGNLLMGDEGVGVHAIRALQKEPCPPAWNSSTAGRADSTCSHT